MDERIGDLRERVQEMRESLLGLLVVSEDHVKKLQGALEGIVEIMSDVVRPEWMDRFDVANHLGVSTKKVQRMVAREEFPPPLPTGKWHRQTVEDWIDDPNKLSGGG